MRSQFFITIALVIGYSIFTLPESVEACGPGRGGGRRLMRRKYPPLVQRQYIPNVSENTVGASGRPEGAIKRKDKRYKELVQNRNPDIEFRDDEGTGADRMMSQRLKEKLSTLAISVMNQWPNVKLRVIEGWDEDNKHSPNSLHYEGRAVDITTNDRDKSKYGMLARLAVEAGFDWVHYESRSHVHCSVKSEKADSIRNNGCFDSASLVETPAGQVQISQLRANDLVLTMNSLTGQLQFSPFLMWLDRDDSAEELFVELTTKSNQIIRLTSSHLIYVADEQIDLTPPLSAPAAAQPGVGADGDETAAEQASPPTGSHDNNSSNDYFQYKVEELPAAAASHEVDAAAAVATGESGANNDGTKHSSPVPGARTNVYQAATFKLASSLPAGLEQKPQITIDEVAYTTYARNLIVGQYLLINDNQAPASPQLDDSASQLIIDQQTRFLYEFSDEETNSRPASRLIFGSASGSGSSLSNQADLIGEPNDRAKLETGSTATLQQPTVKFDQIVSVNFVTRSGRFAPLTREGNIVVNSVVVSCYAVISDHDMAHLSFAPVRWFSYLNEWLFGLKSETPSKTNEITDERPISEQKHKDTQSRLQTRSDYDPPSLIEDDGWQASEHRPGGVHWYPRLLYKIARFVLPTRYLY